MSDLTEVPATPESRGLDVGKSAIEALASLRARPDIHAVNMMAYDVVVSVTRREHFEAERTRVTALEAQLAAETARADGLLAERRGPIRDLVAATEAERDATLSKLAAAEARADREAHRANDAERWREETRVERDSVFDEIRTLRADLARVTAERDETKRSCRNALDNYTNIHRTTRCTSCEGRGGMLDAGGNITEACDDCGGTGGEVGREGGMKTIPCATPGCPHPAREVGWPADCEKCGKTLCETCCDKREDEKRAARGGR